MIRPRTFTVALLSLLAAGPPATPQERATLKGHADSVLQVAFSPDGKLLATGSADKTVKLWDVRTGEAKNTLTGHRAEVDAVAFSPDGKLLAGGDRDGTLKLWDERTGELKTSLRKDFIGGIRWIAFSPDGKTVATANFEGAARLWDVDTCELKRSLLESSNGMWWVAFSPDGKTVWTGTVDGTVRVWDAETGKQTREWLRYGKPLALSPDGTTLENLHRQWDARTGELKKTRTGPVEVEEIHALAFSLDGKILASAASELRLYDAPTWTLKATLTGHDGRVNALAFSPDGKVLAGGGSDHTVKLWDMAKALGRQPTR